MDSIAISWAANKRKRMEDEVTSVTSSTAGSLVGRSLKRFRQNATTEEVASSLVESGLVIRSPEAAEALNVLKHQIKVQQQIKFCQNNTHNKRALELSKARRRSSIGGSAVKKPVKKSAWQRFLLKAKAVAKPTMLSNLSTTMAATKPSPILLPCPTHNMPPFQPRLDIPRFASATTSSAAKSVAKRIEDDLIPKPQSLYLSLIHISEPTRPY